MTRYEKTYIIYQSKQSTIVLKINKTIMKTQKHKIEFKQFVMPDSFPLFENLGGMYIITLQPMSCLFTNDL